RSRAQATDPAPAAAGPETLRGGRRLARRPAGAAADRRGGDHGFGREGEHGLSAHPEVPAAGILPPRRSHRAAQNEDELERLAPLRRVPQACADDRRVLVLPDHGAHADIRPWRIQPITRRHHGSARARRGKWSTIAAMPWSSYTAPAPRSPVRMRTTFSTAVMKIFPSPIPPCRALSTTASTF